MREVIIRSVVISVFAMLFISVAAAANSAVGQHGVSSSDAKQQPNEILSSQEDAAVDSLLNDDEILEQYKQQLMTPEQRAEYEKLQKQLEPRTAETQPSAIKFWQYFWWTVLAYWAVIGVVIDKIRLWRKMRSVKELKGKISVLGMTADALVHISFRVLFSAIAIYAVRWVNSQDIIVGIIYIVVCITLMWLISKLQNHNLNRK